MTQPIEHLREQNRNRLIGLALEHLQLEDIASATIPIPGGDRVIAIGTPAQVRGLLADAPTTVQDHSERGVANASEMMTLLKDAARAWNNESENELDATMERIECFLLDSRRKKSQSPATIAAGQEAANAKDAWIDVKDRLPEPWDGRLFSRSVLVVDMDSRYPHVRMSELNFEEYEGKVVPTVWSGADPTHWQPAPALPAAMAAVGAAGQEGDAS